MIENPKEVVLQRFDFGEAIYAGLLNLQLRWGISMANALELDGMDRLRTSFCRLERWLMSHNERKITRVDLRLMAIACGARRSGQRRVFHSCSFLLLSASSCRRLSSSSFCFLSMAISCRRRRSSSSCFNLSALSSASLLSISS